MEIENNMKKVILTRNAPKAIGPYRQAILSNNTLYCSGQIAIDPTTEELVTDNIKIETNQVMKNIQAIFIMFIWTAFSILLLYLLEALIYYREVVWAICIAAALLFVHMVNMVIYFNITGKEPYKWFKSQ